MRIQTVFKRYELKFMLNQSEKKTVLEKISPYMELDEYKKTTIRNIYFDTENYRLIRRSLERPDYKEKLRLRSYCKADENSDIFVEIKKKYDKVVYKRRLMLNEKDALDWICNKTPCPLSSQIASEIDYFVSFYETLSPVIFLSYDREAYYEKSGGDLRITFDNNILCRENDLSLSSEIYGKEILPKDMTLMEIKCSGGIPLWLTQILSEHKIYKTSFSKYGTAYTNIIFPKLNSKEKEVKEYVRIQ